MTTRPDITLVIPAYNRAGLIAQTLRSALAQQQAFTDIIVVNDGSSDATVEVVQSFGSPVRLINTPNQGVQAARNTGVAAARTDWIALCDSDDLLEPTFTTLVGDGLQQVPNTDILFCNFTLFDQDGPLGDKLAQGPADFLQGARQHGDFVHDVPDLYARTIRFQPFFPTGTVIKKSFFDRLGGYDTAFKGVGGEDWEFTLRALSRGQATVCTRPLSRVRKHAGNDSADSLYMNLGDAHILEHALRTHAGAGQYRVQILASIAQRREAAFDAAFAQGNFKLAQQLTEQMGPAPRGLKPRLKRAITTLPPVLRQPLWRLTQGGAPQSRPIKPARARIVVLEPTWDGLAHLPANLGLLRVIKAAHPQADVTFVGGASHLQLMRDMAPPELWWQLNVIKGLAYEDNNPLPSDIWARYQRLKQLPDSLIQHADLLVLSSCNATVLSALTAMGLGSRACAVLHGNAGELDGWRSRNPLRRLCDFPSALKRFCQHGGRVIVMEERIRVNMSQQYPWLAPRLVCLPHPLLPEEAAPDDAPRALQHPIRVGFAGLASTAKGFPEFLTLAHTLNHQQPGKFEFCAVGMLPRESQGLDQSPLHEPAADPLPRPLFIRRLNTLHYLFVWHHDRYYGNAASGVVYDAINLGLPLLGRKRAQLADWAEQGLDVAHGFDTIEQAIQFLATLEPQAQAPRYQQQCTNLSHLRESMSLSRLGQTFAQTFPLSPRPHP